MNLEVFNSLHVRAATTAGVHLHHRRLPPLPNLSRFSQHLMVRDNIITFIYSLDVYIEDFIVLLL